MVVVSVAVVASAESVAWMVIVRSAGSGFSGFVADGMNSMPLMTVAQSALVVVASPVSVMVTVPSAARAWTARQMVLSRRAWTPA